MPTPGQYSSPACLMHEFEGSSLTLYHNPSCSKSRETLELIRARGAEPRVIEYLKTPPTESELVEIVRKLGIPAERLVRKGEPVFRERYAGKNLSEAEWIQAMVENPILIERPIVVLGDRAMIGRPPQAILTLLS